MVIEELLSAIPYSRWLKVTPNEIYLVRQEYYALAGQWGEWQDIVLTEEVFSFKRCLR